MSDSPWPVCPMCRRPDPPAPPRCLCSHILHEHDHEKKRAQPCSHYGCGCTVFREDLGRVV